MIVFCSYGQPDIMKESKFETVAQWDMRKIGRFLKGRWPRPLGPRWDFTGNMDHWIEAAEQQDFAVLDVENYFWKDREKHDMPDFPDGREFNDVLKAWEKTNGKVKFKYDLSPELRAHVDTWHDHCFAIGFETNSVPALVWSELHDSHVDRRTVGEFIRNLVARTTIVAHNSAHDVRIIKKNWDIGYDEYVRVDDSMVLFNVLYSELPKNLNFCSGVFSSLNRHKDQGTHSLDYLHGDVKSTAEVWVSLKAFAENDPQSWRIYEEFQRPLFPIILEAHLEGIRLDKKKMAELADTLGEKTSKAVAVANQFVQEFSKPEVVTKKGVVKGIEPDPERTINMNSPKQMNEWVYGHCGLKITGLRKGKGGGYPLGKDQIAVLQDQFYPRDDDRDTFELRLANGGHPLVEAKAEYTQAHYLLGGYITPYLHDDRVYPQFQIHGQATGRWSTTGPNIPGAHKSIKPIYIPDPGMCFVGGDWSNAELRIMAELSNDKALKAGFDNKWDLHSMHTSQAFGWDSPKGRFEWALMLRKIEVTWDDIRDRPLHRGDWWGAVEPTQWKKVKVSADADWLTWVVEGGPQPGWQADDDVFRRFNKILVFRLMYGGGTESAAKIPGAKALGLPEQRLVQASKDLIFSHPCWQEFWDDYGHQAKVNKIVRNPNGRARRLLSIHESNRFREGVNHPIQSWVSDTLNVTLRRIKERALWAVLKYTCHDSFNNQCPIERRDELADITKECAEMPLRGDFYIPFDLDSTVYFEDEERSEVQVRVNGEWVAKKED